MSDARFVLLTTMHDLMSNYFVDECPDTTTWEDFDPDIENLRSTVTDLIESDCQDAMPVAALTTYLVEVAFLSGADRYAAEIYTIDASTREGAEHRALMLSLDSVYSDPRVPDLARTAVARPAADPGEKV